MDMVKVAARTSQNKGAIGGINHAVSREMEKQGITAYAQPSQEKKR